MDFLKSDISYSLNEVKQLSFTPVIGKKVVNVQFRCTYLYQYNCTVLVLLKSAE